MDRYFSRRSNLTPLAVAPWVLVGILFLEPCILPRCEAQQDDKDKVIEQLKKVIEAQKCQIDDFDKRMRDFRAAIDTELRLNNEEIKRVLENQKKQNDAFQKALEARNRELDDYAKRIRDLQEKLIASQEEAKAERLKATAAEAQAKVLRARHDALLEVVRELQVQKAKAEVAKANDSPKRDPGLNPPAVAVNGKIEKVVGDLVQINLGADHGLAKAHTLDVYRLQPEAKYLGMIRIVEASATTAIGRYTSPMGKPAGGMLKVGDNVTSKLTLDRK